MIQAEGRICLVELRNQPNCEGQKLGGQEDGRNWYAYCDSSPTGIVDPEGLDSQAEIPFKLPNGPLGPPTYGPGDPNDPNSPLKPPKLDPGPPYSLPTNGPPMNSGPTFGKKPPKDGVYPNEKGGVTSKNGNLTFGNGVKGGSHGKNGKPGKAGGTNVTVGWGTSW